jgi:hypothetical protein
LSNDYPFELSLILAVVIALPVLIGLISAHFFNARLWKAIVASALGVAVVGIVVAAAVVAEDASLREKLASIFGDIAFARRETLIFQAPKSLSEGDSSHVELIINSGDSDEQMVAAIAALQPPNSKPADRQTEYSKIEGHHPVITAELVGVAFMIAPSGPQRVEAQANPKVRSLKWQWQIQAPTDANLSPAGEDKLLSLVLKGQLSREKAARVFQLEAPKPVSIHVFPRKESLVKRASDLLTGMSGIWTAIAGIAAAVAAAFAWLRRGRSRAPQARPADQD